MYSYILHSTRCISVCEVVSDNHFGPFTEIFYTVLPRNNLTVHLPAVAPGLYASCVRAARGRNLRLLDAPKPRTLHINLRCIVGTIVK